MADGLGLEDILRGGNIGWMTRKVCILELPRDISFVLCCMWDLLRGRGGSHKDIAALSLEAGIQHGVLGQHFKSCRGDVRLVGSMQRLFRQYNF